MAMPEETKSTNDETNGGADPIPKDTVEDSNENSSLINELLYGIEDAPPWYLCIPLGFQHYLTMFGSTLSIPLILAPHLCFHGDYLGLSELVNTIFFVSGVCTLLQTTLGIRLPIIQGATFAFLTPAIAIMSLPQWSCPYSHMENNGFVNETLAAIGSPEHREMWQTRLCMITAVGLSNIQFVDLNSTRNLFVLGFSIFLGLCFPQWLGQNPHAINTGSSFVDQITRVLLSTSMFVGGVTGFLLDNTIPGTDAERGLNKWRPLIGGSLGFQRLKYRPYDLPLVQKYINRWRWARYVPFCPTFGTPRRDKNHTDDPVQIFVD